MKRTCLRLFALLLFSLPATALAAPDAGRPVRIGAFNYYPGIFQTTDGQIKGFYVDMLTAIAERDGWQIEYVYGTWSDGLKRLKAGEIDILTSVAYTEERAAWMDYTSAPLLTVWGELYVHEDSDVKGIRDVRNRKIAVMKGDFNAATFVDLVQKFDIPCDFVEVDDFNEVFQAIKGQKVEGGVVNSTSGAARQKDFPVKSSGVIFNPFDIHFTVSKQQNRDLLQSLDRYLAGWRKDRNSPYHQALQRWSHGTAAAVEVTPPWLKKSLILLLVLSGGSLLFIALLRLRVGQATREIHSREMKLQQNQQRYRSLFENSPVSLWEEDFSAVKSCLDELKREPIGDIACYLQQHPEVIQECAEQVKILDTNRASLTLHGAESKEELLENLSRTFTPDSFRTFSEELVAIWNGETFLESEGMVKTLQGKKMQVVLLWQVMPGHEQRLDRVLVSLLDITERTEALRAKDLALASEEASRRQIDSLLQSVIDGIVVADGENRIVMMNRTAEALLGVTQQQAAGETMDQAITEPGFCDHLEALMTWREGPAVIMELTDSRNGEKKAVQGRAFSASDERGDRTGVIFILRDVTREQASDRMKNEFIATAAHELRTPLASVMGFSEYLLEQNELDRSKQEEYLSIIFEKSELLRRIIDDLLDLSRVGTGRLIRLEKKDCDLAPLLHKMVVSYQKEFPSHRFDRLIGGQQLTASADPYKIEQVLENLLSNAVKFSPEGGVIEVRGEKTGGEIQISVHDSGLGMTPEQTEQVFERFYRADTSDTGKQGFGLGMTIAKAIVEAHYGRIRVESTPGQGTAVIFTLPAQEPSTTVQGR